MRIGALVYVRLDSARLPGKALAKIGGQSLVSIVLARAKRINATHLILASTDRETDLPLKDVAEQEEVYFFSGHKDDLVERTLATIRRYKLDRVVRINGDSPLVSPELINTGLTHMMEGFSFVTNLYPRSFPYGVAVEVFDGSFYESMSALATATQREHVTAHLYPHMSRIRYKNILNDHDLSTAPPLTVDTQEDLDLYKRVIEENDLDPTGVDFVEYLRKLEEMKK